MKLFTFPRLFGRAQPVRPATAQVHTAYGELPPWLRRDREAWPPPLSPPPLEHYAPKKREPAAAPPPPEMGFVISLSRERQLRLSRILRHGYQLGVAAPAPNVVLLRRAA